MEKAPSVEGEVSSEDSPEDVKKTRETCIVKTSTQFKQPIEGTALVLDVKSQFEGEAEFVRGTWDGYLHGESVVLVLTEKAQAEYVEHLKKVGLDNYKQGLSVMIQPFKGRVSHASVDGVQAQAPDSLKIEGDLQKFTVTLPSMTLELKTTLYR